MRIWQLKFTIIILSSIGLWGVGGISLMHWHGEASCPMLGNMPACYLILVAYGLIFGSMLLSINKKSLVIFLIGWLPVILLGLAGVIGEITSTLACPTSEIGIPKCYFSTGLAMMIGLLYSQAYRRIYKRRLKDLIN